MIIMIFVELLVLIVIIVLVIVMISRQKRFEETIRDLGAKVEHLLRERENERLRAHEQTQALLQVSLQAQEQSISMPAHNTTLKEASAPLPPPVGLPYPPSADAPFPQPVITRMPAHTQTKRASSAAATLHDTSKKRSLENIFGRKVFGFVAAAMVFIGLVFLGFLVLPELTVTVKIILMFVLSAAISVSGYLLNHRYQNYFALALLGCGCGAIFIAIEVTHLYFGVLDDIPTYAIVLIWMAATLFVERQTQSVVVSIIAHAGMLFSVCVGYAYGLEDDKLLFLLGYQFISSLVIVGGNILSCKKMYRLGLFISLLLTVYASLFMWHAFMGYGSSFMSSLPVPLISLAFIVQFLASSLLAYLLFVSITRLENKTHRILLQLANTVLWLGALVLNITLLIGKLTMIFGGSRFGDIPFERFDTVPLAFTLSLLIVFAVLFCVIGLRRMVKFNRQMETETVFVLILFACCLLLYQTGLHIQINDSVTTSASVTLNFWAGFVDLREGPVRFGPALTYLVLPLAASIVVYRLTKERLFLRLAFIIIGIDAFHMVFYGFKALTRFSGALWLSFLYLVVLLALYVLVFFLFGTEQREKRLSPFRIVAVLGLEISVFSIFDSGTFLLDGSSGIAWALGSNDLVLALTLLVVLCLLAVLHFSKQDRPDGFFLGNNSVVIALLALFVTYHFGWNREMSLSGSGLIVVSILSASSCLIALALIFDRLRLLAARMATSARSPQVPQQKQGPQESQASPKPLPQRGVEVITAIVLHLLILSIITALTGSTDMTYAFSLTCMVIALLIVILGFWTHTKSIRLFGLIVIIACVLKLVILDAAGLDLPIRVIAFIGGGAICFGISALYNFAVKRFDFERV